MSIVYSQLDEDKSILFHNNDLESALFDKKNHIGASGYFSTCINLLKSIIGTGLLALPNTFKVLGPLLSIPLLLLFAYFSIVGLRIYSLCGMRAGVDSIGLVCKMVDWRLQIIVDIALLIMCIGTIVSYFSIIGDFVPNLISIFNLSREVCVSLSCLIILPLAFIKNIQHLGYSSILGLIGILFIIYLSIQLIFTQGISKEQVPLVQFSNEGFKQLNVIVFVFTCHQNLLHIKSNAKDQSEKFIGSVLNTCIGISGAVYVMFSIASLLVFGSEIDANILNNYSDGALTKLAKWLYVAMAIFSFPLMIAPAKTAFSNLAPFHLNQSTSSIIIVIISLLLGLFIKDLSVISSFIGVFASVPICYLLPGYLHYRYFNDDPSSDKNYKINSFTSIIMCLFGLFLIISFVLM